MSGGRNVCYQLKQIIIVIIYRWFLLKKFNAHTPEATLLIWNRTGNYLSFSQKHWGK